MCPAGCCLTQTAPALRTLQTPTWRQGWRVYRTAALKLGFSNSGPLDNFEEGVRNRTDLVVIPPVRGAAHHQDLIAEHPQDTPELVRARQLILDTLRRFAAKCLCRIL